MDYIDYNGAAKPNDPNNFIWQKSIFSPLFASAHQKRPFELPAFRDAFVGPSTLLEGEGKKTRSEPTPGWRCCL